MTDKDRKFYEKWNRTRSRGMAKFLAWRGLFLGLALAFLKTALDVLRILGTAQTQEEAAEVFRAIIEGYILTIGVEMLVSFVVLTLLSVWGFWIVWQKREKRFQELAQITDAKDIPKDYSIPEARGVKEKFPDYDWERTGR